MKYDRNNILNIFFSMNSREGGTKMIEITEAPTIKKEKKSKKKKADKEAVSTDSDSETKQRRESQSSIGSTGDLSILTSPKPAGRRRNSSVSSRDEGGKKRRNSSAYDSSDSAASTSPYRGKKISSQAAGHYGQPEDPQPYSYSSEANYSLHSEPISQPTPHFTPNVPPPTHTQQIPQQQQMFSPAKTTEQTEQPAQMQLTNEQINLAQELFQ